MSLGAEARLVLLVWGLYLADGVLLRPDEAVLMPAGRGWRAAFGARTWTLAGRQPWLAPLWLPHRALFRLRWRPDAPPAAAGVPLVADESSAEMSALQRACSRLAGEGRS